MSYLSAIAAIFSLVLAGITVDRIYRRFAMRNPSLGPFRDAGKCGSCKGGSGCNDSACDVPGTDAGTTSRH